VDASAKAQKSGVLLLTSSKLEAGILKNVKENLHTKTQSPVFTMISPKKNK
jgi:hypothetical protein